MSVVGLSRIPTITQIWKSAACPFDKSSSPASSEFAPSESINDRVGLYRGDITTLDLDAIVNAANNSLLGGGGVDGAIHRAAGPGLRAECAPLGGCPTGEARITGGHRLPAKHVIHTVGPIFESKRVSEPLLRSCYEESLKLAVEKGVKTVAFSGISTGVYGYPSGEAARVACETVRKFLDKDQQGVLTRVVFVTFLDKDVDAYNTAIPKFFPKAD